MNRTERHVHQEWTQCKHRDGQCCDACHLEPIDEAVIIDGDRVRAWVAHNYSAESKRRVAEGYEATPEDQAKFSQAYAAGLFRRPAQAQVSA